MTGATTGPQPVVQPGKVCDLLDGTPPWQELGGVSAG